MGEDPVLTPNLDKFASWAFSFDNAVACRPVSGPNRACLMTGKYPINNGVFANSVPLDPSENTLGDLCKRAGYVTAYIGKWHLNGMDDQAAADRRHGFDLWIQSIGHSPFDQRYIIQGADKPVNIRGKWSPTYEVEQGIRFMDSVKTGDRPFCLVLSFNPPHTSGGLGFENRYQPGVFQKDGSIKYGYGYGGPREYEALYQDNDYTANPIRGNVRPIGKSKAESGTVVPGYFGAITAIDNDFGTLMTYLETNNLLENTIVVFTADHGESMGSQGLMTKGTWFEESVGVPCIIGWKGKTVSKRVKNVINSIDLLPSLLGLSEIPIPNDIDGTDYSPLLLGHEFNAPEYAFLSFDFGGLAELNAPRYWRGIYTERYTYVLCGMYNRRNFTKNGIALYDRQKDPLQLNPIGKGEGYDRIIDELHAILVARLDATGDPFISRYWNDSNPGFPKLNKYNLDLKEIERDIKSGRLKPNEIKKYWKEKQRDK